MRSRIHIFLCMMKIITIIVAPKVLPPNTPYFEGPSTILNATGCLSNLTYPSPAVVSLNLSSCVTLYRYTEDGECDSEQFAIIPPNDPVVINLDQLDFASDWVSSISRCNYCPTGILPRVQAYSFFVSDHKAVSGHHWLFTTDEFDNSLNQSNICGQILDDFPVPLFLSVVSGCVQFYSSNDCTTTDPEINKFQPIHGVREWDTLQPLKSVSHCFLHCVPQLEKSYIGVRGRYVEEDEPAFSGIRVSLSSGLREDVYANNLDERCLEAPKKDVSSVARVVAKDICVVLYANNQCNANWIVSKPTVLEAKGEKIAAISVPDIYRKLSHVKSYMLCKTLTLFEDYHLLLSKTHFLKDYATVDTIRILQYFGFSQILNISGCSVLPHPLTMQSSIDSYGKCILLFVENNCTGNYERLETGSPALWSMGMLDPIESYQSIQLCSSNAQKTKTGFYLHYNFTLFERYLLNSTTGYNWTFSSLENQSDVCWELPYYYRSSIYYPGVRVNRGCFKLFVGLKCNPFSQHVTLNSSSKVVHLYHGLRQISNGQITTTLGSFTSCADSVKHPKIQSTISRQSLNFPYNFPNGTFYAMRPGEASSTFRLYSCKAIPRTYRSTAQHHVDELSLMYVKNDCIFVFDKKDCTMSENTTLPIVLNATDGPLERNLTEKPFWGRPVSVVSAIACDRFTTEYDELHRIFMIEHERRRAKNSTESGTSSQAVYIGLSVTFGTLLVIGLAVLIYFIVRISHKNKLSSLELDVFFNGSDEPSTSNEDVIQNTAINKELEIPSTSFTYVKSDDGTLVVLGSGCFGKVIRGILHAGFDELNNCQLTKNVAIKTPKIGITLEQIRSLLCEIKICAFVEKHKNIVEFVGFCLEDIRLGKVSLILDLCENGSLLQYLRDHAKDFQKNCKIENFEHASTELRVGCSENNYANNETFDYCRLLRWCQEITEGMDFLSSKQVLHADLATRNCLLDLDLQIKITDFGLSRKLYDYGNYVKKSKAMLPWRWMALESLKSFTFSVKTDVWSYGVCLWEIFSFGDTPYPTLNWDDGFIENLSAGLRLSKPKLCPEYCYQLMRKCWEEDPEHRYDFMELRKAISDFRQETFCNKVVEGDHSGIYTVLLEKL